MTMQPTQKERDAFAAYIEGDSDSPARIAKANGIVDGLFDEEVTLYHSVGDLPRPGVVFADHSYPAFSRKQMIEFGASRVEAAARLIESYPEWLGRNAKREIAAAIRRLTLLEEPPATR